MIDKAVYAMLGVVAYIEQQIKRWRAENDNLEPTTIIIGKQEWEILGCENGANRSIRGVKVIPSDQLEGGVIVS